MYDIWLGNLGAISELCKPHHHTWKFIIMGEREYILKPTQTKTMQVYFFSTFPHILIDKYSYNEIKLINYFHSVWLIWSNFSSMNLFICWLVDWFLERGEGREKERERNIDLLPLARTPTGDCTCNLGMCPDREWNQQPIDLQDDAQPNEPHQSGLQHNSLLLLIIQLACAGYPCWPISLNDLVNP